MSHIRRSSDPKLLKREVTIDLHDTSFSPSHGLREDLCCGGSRRINPGLDSNTFVSGMTTYVFIVYNNLISMAKTRHHTYIHRCLYMTCFLNTDHRLVTIQ